MNAQDFLKIANEISPLDRDKFENYYTQVITPRLVNVAKKRERELSIHNDRNAWCKIGYEIFGDKMSLGKRVYAMKPFLKEKGFSVSKTTCDTYFYIRF